MRYCIRCVQPDTRPGIFFSSDGVCGACLWEDEKKNIDWAHRETELKNIASWAKSQHAPYDCVIGVSGGKDSVFQALYARDKLGLRPLLVNSEASFTTEIGQKNLENIKQLGFDTIGLRVNPKIMKELVRRDFFAALNIARPSEYPLYASACIVAEKFEIPLIIQGENAGQTLGASLDTGTGGDAFYQFRLNTVKNDPVDLYAQNGILKEDLWLYRSNHKKLQDKGVRSIFLSYYAKEWSQIENAAFALQHGLEIMPPEMDPYFHGTYRRFQSLDYYYRPLNQLFKFVKYGFGMATDQACYDIRAGLISREEGIFLVQELDHACGEKFIDDICEYIGISSQKFWEHVNTFRGPMWRKSGTEYLLENPIWEQVKIKGSHSIKAIMQRLGM